MRFLSISLLIALFLSRMLLASDSDNLALPEHGAFVLASSFADYEQYYPDRILDGRTDTFWRASEAGRPEWLEIRWPVLLEMDGLRILSPQRPGKGSITLSRWNSGRWEALQQVVCEPGEHLNYRFSAIKTDRIRIALAASEGEPHEITSIQVHGPEQTLPGDLSPRWTASYIWYPEPGRTYKAGSPYYYRKTFEIKDSDALRSASIQARSNDHYAISINGKTVYQTSSARTGKAIPVAHYLRPGKNVIAIEANLNSTPTWGLGLLIAELHLIGADGTRQIGTDGSWKASNQPDESWQEIGFNDENWKQAHTFFAPPEGPWGDIRYTVSLAEESAAIKEVSIAPFQPKPGDEVEISFLLDPASPLKGDYAFMVELGRTGLNPSKTDFRVTTVLAEATPVDKGSLAVKARLTLPSHTPGGEIPLFLKAFDRRKAFQLQLHQKKPAQEGAVGMLHVQRSNQEGESKALASVTIDPHSHAIRVNGHAYPPICWSPLTPTFEKFEGYSKAGIDLFFLSTNQKLGPANWRELTFPAVDESISNLLQINPNAYIILKVELRPTFEWMDANPKERMLKANGKPGPQSFASQRYITLVEDSLSELLSYLASRSYRDRVIGFMLWAPGRADGGLGGAEDNIWQSDRRKVVIGDYNPQAIAAFRQWLRVRYDDSIPNLRKAWQKSNVSFETAEPDRTALIAEGVDGGVFTDPLRGRAPYDYFEFLSQLLPEFYLRMGRLIKEKTCGKALVGVHYGYIIDQVRAMHPGTGIQNGNFYLSTMLENDAIDFYCGSTVYGAARKDGNAFQVRLPWGSINLHGRLYMNDGDYRTYLAYPITYGRQQCEQESVNILRRDLGSTLIRKIGLWYADFSKETGRSAVGWFLSPPLLSEISAVQRLAEERVETPVRSTTRIAVFLDEKSYFTHDFYASPLLYENLATRLIYQELPRVGAPFDIFTLADLKDPRVQEQYQLFIFLNAFRLTATDQEQIEALKANGNTLLWFYAPGYFRDGKALSAEAIGETIGITTRAIAQTPPRYTLSAEHPQLKTISERVSRLGLISGKRQRKTLGDHATRLRPGFVVDDSAAEALAHWPDGSVAVAQRDFGTWKSVYSALPYMSASFLREIARHAGVHIYANEDILLDADSGLLTIHHGDGAPRKLQIHLPEANNVTDALTGELVGKGIKTFPLEFSENETRLYRLEPSAD